MRKRVFFMLLAVLFLFSCACALAHSGKTDEDGGHYNRSTGEYHYHHGYPEHQHPGGVCPYDYDDRTGWNSGSSSGGSSAEKTQIAFNLLNVDEYLASRADTTGGVLYLSSGIYIKSKSALLAVFIVGAIFLILLFATIPRRNRLYKIEHELQEKEREIRDQRFYIQNKSERLKQLTQENENLRLKLKDVTDRAVRKVNALQQERDDLHQVLLLGTPQGEDATRDLVVRTFAGKPAEEFANIPSDTCIGVDGLPREHGAPKGSWGKKYTAYRSASGHTYHKTSGCAGADTPLHVLHVGSLIPCKRCKPSLPDMQWFEDYKRVKTLKDKYDIP